MSFRDDEPPPANSSGGRQPIHRGSDRVRLVAYSNDKAPLEENEQQVLLELTDLSSASERSGLDLVAVLDVSGSMGGSGTTKLDKLKTAMKFVISKLGPMDRLSIVSFSSVAEKLCWLRLMTVDAKEELKGIVEKLSAGGSTNMRDGLKMGLDVLAQRQYSSGRVSSVVLMSDGDEDFPGASLAVDARGTAVYTFGFGEDHDAKALQAIANNSQGGTFLYVSDDESLTKRFAEIMVAGLLSVVVQDLELSVWPQPGHSTIDEVVAGSYHTEPTVDGGGYSVRFGDLFGGEVRKVIVHLLLPAVHRGYRVTVIYAQCSYKIHGETFYSPRDGHLRCVIHRTGSASRDATKKKPEVEEELDRILYMTMIEKVIEMKDEQSARRKLEETQKVLEAKQPNRMVVILRAEIQQVLQLKWKDLLARLLEHLTSHRRQRGGNIFAPRRTAKVVAQAVEFDKDPNRPPPSVDDDVKKEVEAMTRPVADRGQPRKRRVLVELREHRTTSGWLAWAMVVLCTLLAVGIIVAGVAVFVVYIFFKPKMPYLVVSNAQLVLLQYDQGGTIQSLQMSITVVAENNNSKADAAFSRVDLALGFHGADVVLLQAEPFVVPRESSLPLRYNAVAMPGPALDSAGMQAMDESLKAGVVPFDLFGKARTRWKVGIFVKLRYWTRISCHLRFFFPGNGTVMPTDRDRCRSR